WPSRPRTTGQHASCPERSSGSPTPAALSRRCSAVGRALGRADRSGKASADRRRLGAPGEESVWPAEAASIDSTARGGDDSVGGKYPEPRRPGEGATPAAGCQAWPVYGG